MHAKISGRGPGRAKKLPGFTCEISKAFVTNPPQEPISTRQQERWKAGTNHWSSGSTNRHRANAP